jgi:hypothetical protein
MSSRSSLGTLVRVCERRCAPHGGLLPFDVQSAQGDLAGALKSYRDSLGIAEKLAKKVRPRTVLLREGLDRTPQRAYFIHEEEVPRAGARVTQSFQRTRWRDGSVWVWLGVRKLTGRGEGSKRRLKARKTFPARSPSASTHSCASESVGARGFSHITAFPA